MSEGFPIHALRPGHKVLSLFSAAFGGRQDVKYIFEAGVKDCLCVDINQFGLRLMPFPYKYLTDDCFEYINRAYSGGFKFDVIVSDHWTNQDPKIHDEYFEKLDSMAHTLILGISQVYLNTLPKPPSGILYKRSHYMGGVYWRLIEKK